MRRAILAGLAVLLAVGMPTTVRAESQAGPMVVLDTMFTLDPNDDSRAASDCFDVPYGVLLTTAVWTMEDDTSGERVNFVFKEGELIRLKTSLTMNPTVAAGYAGAGTYCYWIVASHTHLDTVAPIRHARLTITADGNWPIRQH